MTTGLLDRAPQTALSPEVETPGQLEPSERRVELLRDRIWSAGVAQFVEAAQARRPRIVYRVGGSHAE